MLKTFNLNKKGRHKNTYSLKTYKQKTYTFWISIYMLGLNPLFGYVVESSIF